jgi:hypothetical protein
VTSNRPLTGAGSTAASHNPPPGRLVSWLVTSVLVGWAIVYNIMRIGGRSPRGAAWVSLLIGLGIGAVIFAITWSVWRRVIGSGRYRLHEIDEIPPPSRLDGRQRLALDLLWPAVAVLAAAAIVVGAVMFGIWAADDTDRGWLNVILAGWNLLVGAWFALEARELHARHGEAVESIGMAAMLTAVLAGVALSREVFTPGQVALIVIAGISGAVASYSVWRILGSRGFPFGILVALIVAGLAVALPLTA